MQVVSQEVSTHCSSMAIIDAEEWTLWPVLAIKVFAFWFHDVKDDRNSVFIIISNYTLISVRPISSHKTIPFVWKLRILVFGQNFIAFPLTHSDLVTKLLEIEVTSTHPSTWCSFHLISQGTIFAFCNWSFLWGSFGLWVGFFLGNLWLFCGRYYEFVWIFLLYLFLVEKRWCWLSSWCWVKVDSMWWLFVIKKPLSIVSRSPHRLLLSLCLPSRRHPLFRRWNSLSRWYSFSAWDSWFVCDTSLVCYRHLVLTLPCLWFLVKVVCTIVANVCRQGSVSVEVTSRIVVVLGQWVVARRLEATSQVCIRIGNWTCLLRHSHRNLSSSVIHSTRWSSWHSVSWIGSKLVIDLCLDCSSLSVWITTAFRPHIWGECWLRLVKLLTYHYLSHWLRTHSPLMHRPWHNLVFADYLDLIKTLMHVSGQLRIVKASSMTWRSNSAVHLATSFCLGTIEVLGLRSSLVDLTHFGLAISFVLLMVPKPTHVECFVEDLRVFIESSQLVGSITNVMACSWNGWSLAWIVDVL